MTDLREEHWILHRDRETGKVAKMERVATEWHREEPAASRTRRSGDGVS